MFAGKRVVITGGTGSFGRAFTKWLLTQSVEKVVILSRSEHKQDAMRRYVNDDRLRFLLGDVRDLRRLQMAFQRADIIIHAAALKRVERGEQDPDEFVKTNIMGAMNVVHAALDNNVMRVVALSTDKSSAAVTLYGATKLCAEKYIVAANHYSGKHIKTQLAAVRYGNVMGSAGSVVPLWRNLISENKPLTLTDPGCTRFWLTMEEAVQLVAKATKRMRGGEIFIPKCPSFKVSDLAWAMAGHTYVPGVITIGMRGIEKKHESLLSLDEARAATDCGDVYAIGVKGNPLPPGFEYRSDLNEWQLSQDELAERVKGL